MITKSSAWIAAAFSRKSIMSELKSVMFQFGRLVRFITYLQGNKFYF